jgi:hypothetical protein
MRRPAPPRRRDGEETACFSYTVWQLAPSCALFVIVRLWRETAQGHGHLLLVYDDIQVASETVCLFPTPVPTGLFGALATKARTMTTTIADNEAPAPTATPVTAGPGRFKFIAALSF